jgi:chromosome partitioning protein
LKTIVVTSQKGGSGKTTLAAHLAVEVERAGDGPAWLIDTDKQGTLSLWHERRKRLQESGGAYCFIDTPPTISEQSETVLGLADLVLIPVRPSPADLWAVSETVALVKAAAKPFLFVITQAKAQASITAQTIAALSEHGRVAQTFIADRVPYAVAMTGGRTAPELGAKTPAAEEIAGVWRDVKSCFHEKMKATKQVRSMANG